MRTLKPVSLARASRTFRQGFWLRSKEFLKARRWLVVKMVRGRFGPRRPSMRPVLVVSWPLFGPIGVSWPAARPAACEVGLAKADAADELEEAADFERLLAAFDWPPNGLGACGCWRLLETAGGFPVAWLLLFFTPDWAVWDAPSALCVREPEVELPIWRLG